MNRSAIMLGVTALLPGCGDRSAPFSLPDGCYFAEYNGDPILKVEGERGSVLAPGDVREVRLRARIEGQEAYVEVTPSFLLEWPGSPLAPSERFTAMNIPSVPTTRFKIANEAAGPAILVNLSASGEELIRRGPCSGRTATIEADQNAGEATNASGLAR